MSWVAAVRMVGDRFFMWDMAKLWGLASVFLAVLLLGIGLIQESPYAVRLAVIVPAWTFVGFYILSVLIALVFFLNKYYVQYVIADEGVRSDLARWTGKMSRAVAAGNLILGVLQTSSIAAGVGLLADTQRSVFMPWSKIRKITPFPSVRVITLSNSWRPVVRLHCPTDDIFREVTDLLKAGKGVR